MTFLVKDGTAHESEIDLSVEPHTSCDQAIDEHDVISSTRERRRLTHKSLVSARFSDDFEEDDVIQVQADCSVPAFAENLDEKRTVVGTIGATGCEGDLLPVAVETSCQTGETEFGRHEHTVQLLEKGDDTVQLLEKCPKPMTRRQNRATREASAVVSSGRSATELVVPGERGKDEISPA